VCIYSIFLGHSTVAKYCTHILMQIYLVLSYLTIDNNIVKAVWNSGVQSCTLSSLSLSLATKYDMLGHFMIYKLTCFLFFYQNIADIYGSILDVSADLISETPLKVKSTPLSPKSLSQDVIRYLGIVTKKG